MKTEIATKSKKVNIESYQESWKKLTLEKIAELAKDAYLPNNNEEIPYIGLEHINQQTLSLNSIGKSSDVTSNKFRFEDGDILFGKLRPYFRKVYRPNFSGICSTDIWVVRAKPKIDQGWLFYLLAGEDFIKLASGGSSGTRMPRADWQHLKDTIWSVPELLEQKKIAEVLLSLDDKIRINKKIIDNFDDIAGNLFKQQFIDVEDGLTDKWQTRELGDFFPIKTGKKDANVATQNGEYPFFSCSQDILATDEFSFDSSSILLAGNGDFNVKWYEGKFEAYQRTYVLTPYKKELLGFLYYLTKHFLNDITAGHRGSVIRFITKGMIENFKIKIPNNTELEQKAKIFNEIIQAIDSYKNENHKLSKIRDSLLPKLMSGKIRVN